MILVALLRRDIVPDDLGLIPHFLSEDDDRPAAVQFNEQYAHGGGWQPQPGFKLQKDKSLKYPGDPPFKPIARIELRDEVIYVYPYGYVAVVQPDGSFEACRMD
jgi:hypothetical protein